MDKKIYFNSDIEVGGRHMLNIANANPINNDFYIYEDKVILYQCNILNILSIRLYKFDKKTKKKPFLTLSPLPPESETKSGERQV